MVIRRAVLAVAAAAAARIAAENQRKILGVVAER
jgi:hypothetical protein